MSQSACRAADAGGPIDVSIILPMYNGARWLPACLQAMLDQDFQGTMELCVFDDTSKDDSLDIISCWASRLEQRGIPTLVSGHDSAEPRGVGYAKNQAVAQSRGRYLCFQDVDDVMMPQRVRLQYEAAVRNPSSIIGCQIRREPEGSTERYTRWINSLSPEQLLTQGVPEDLLFFYQSLRQGGGVCRVDRCLLVYGYHEQAASQSVLEETIWKHRVTFLQERILNQWDAFTIWNAGKQGRRLYRSLSPTNQKKVRAFCDVDHKKIRKGFYTYEESEETLKPRVPILHFRATISPYIVCVKLDMTGGELEANLLSLRLKEGVDYYHFS